MNLENVCHSNQGSVSSAGEPTETADEEKITSKVQSVQKRNMLGKETSS